MASETVARVDRRIDSLSAEVAATAGAIRKLEVEFEASISVLFEQIGRLDDKLASATGLTEEVSALRTGIDKLQATFGTAVAENEGAAASPQLSASDQPDRRPQLALTLNTASFEDLRELGLSVTQAARVIAYRDTHGGFRELDQLREIRGLSAEDLRLLTEGSTL